MGAKLIDLTGKRFGKLTVIRRDSDKVLPSGSKVARWFCECDCGNTVSVIGSNLRKGTSKSCGCQFKHFSNLVGQVFNDLTVLERDSEYVNCKGYNVSAWRCRCVCGKEITVSENSLVSGHTKSCGCRMCRNKIDDADMIGRKFGRLTVLSRAGKHKTPSGPVLDTWNCVCECGNHTVSLGRALRNGTTQSCGCLRAEHMSVKERRPYSEDWVEAFFVECGFTYSTQKTYPGLVGVNGGLLSYDFHVVTPDGFEFLVECQGGQHYYPVDFFGGQAQFEKQVEHDNRKRGYAKQNGIALLEIDCTSMDVDTILSQLTTFLSS